MGEIYLFLFKKIFICLIIYLAALGLSCGMWDLCCGMWDLCCGMQDLQLQHTGSSSAACELLVAACGIQFPDQGSNPGPLHWECGVLATGPPGKSPRMGEILNGKDRVDVTELTFE